MTILGSRAGIRRIALSSCASTWGKAGFGLSQLVFTAPEMWLIVVCAGMAAALAAGTAALVLRAAPEKALVIAIIAIPLPAALDVPLRRWILGTLVCLVMVRDCLRARAR